MYNIDDSDLNREVFHRTRAKYIKWIKRQNSILKQNDRLKWIVESLAILVCIIVNKSSLKKTISCSTIHTKEEIKDDIFSMNPNS